MYSNSTYKVPAELYFFDDDKKFSVSVKGNLPLDEILKIAGSINVETRHPCMNNENLPGVCTPEKSLEFYEFMGNQWMESKKQEMLDAMRENQFQEWIDQTDNHYNWNVYQYYSFTEDLASVRLYPSPHKQNSEGVEPGKIQCNFNFLKIQKYDGSPACVSVQTREKLMQRGWTNEFKVNSEKYVEISLIGFVHGQLVNEPITDFTIKLEGSGYNYHEPDLLIKTDKDDVVWSNEDFPSLHFGRTQPGYFCKEYNFDEIGGPVSLNSTGYYYLIINFEDTGGLSQGFSVREAMTSGGNIPSYGDHCETSSNKPQ
jgi:hypothetical protein